MSVEVTQTALDAGEIAISGVVTSTSAAEPVIGDTGPRDEPPELGLDDGR